MQNVETARAVGPYNGCCILHLHLGGVDLLAVLAEYAGDVCQILALAVLVVRPVREWMLGTGVIREGLRCLLRSEILGLYHRRREAKQLKEYEYQNLEFCYRAYKALKGNSFAEHIYEEMQEWEIV